MNKCLICKKKNVSEFWDNARPVNKGVCCDKCNFEKVIPVRLKKIGRTMA